MMTYRYKSEGDRLYLYCLCDSTYIFLARMRSVLQNLCFTDIKTDGYAIPSDKVPKDKPWCNYEYECSGVFPDNELRSKFRGDGIITFDVTSLSKEMDNEITGSTITIRFGGENDEDSN